MTINVDRIIGVVDAVKLPIWVAMLAITGYAYKSPWFIPLLLVCLAGTASLALYYYNLLYKVRGAPWQAIGPKDVAVVTGGSQGLGKHIVDNLLHQGAEVIVLDITSPSIDNVKFVKCDLAQPAQVEPALNTIVSELEKQLKQITVLVNNAGVRHTEGVLSMAPEKLETIFQINVFSPLMITRTIYDHYRKNETHQPPLRVCFVSSVLGILAPRNLGVYSATKAAITQMYDALVREHRDETDWLRFLLVLPGQMDTAMFNDVTPSKTFFAPVVVANKLAKTIVAKLNTGEIGVVCAPAYGNVLPVVKVLPECVQHWCRQFTEMDDKVGN